MSFSYPTPQPCSNIKDPDIRRELEKLYTYINQFLAGQDGKSNEAWVVTKGPDEVIESLGNNDLIADPQAHTLWHYDAQADSTERFRELGGVLCKIVSGSGPTYTVQRCSPDKSIVWGKQFAAYDVNGISPSVGDGVNIKWMRIPKTKIVLAYFATGATGASGFSGYSGFSGDNPGTSGYSGFSGVSGFSGYSGFSGSGTSGYSGYSGANPGASGYSGYSGISGWSGISGAGSSLSNTLPAAVVMTGGTSGTASTASRGNHQHDIANQGAGAYRKGIFFDSTGDATVDYERSF